MKPINNRINPLTPQSCIALAVLLLNLTAGQLNAAEPQAAPVTPDSLQLSNEELLNLAGLSQLPEELRIRWLSLVQESYVYQHQNILNEGQLLIRQLGELIETFEGRIPTEKQPGYSAYETLSSSLINLLDKLSFAIILDLNEADVQAVLSNYKTERDEITQQLETDRQKLLQEGTDLLRQHQSDPYFLKYPHRREVIAELYFRLTELTYQQAQEEFYAQQDEFIRTIGELSKTDPRAASGLKPPLPNYGRVQAMYQRIIDEYPTSSYADDALYNIGVIIAEGNTRTDKVNANRIFENLVQLYPSGDYVLNALRRIADFYFTPPQPNIQRAIDIYNRIIAEFPKSEYRIEALYKLGWCYYRLSDLPQAVEYFARTLDVIYQKKGGKGESSIIASIAKESINYIGVCYSVDPREWKSAGADSLIAWLDNNPERRKMYGRELLIQLGDIFRNQIGKYKDAVVVYNYYVQRMPLDPQSPGVQQNVVDIYQKGEIFDPGQALSEKIRFFTTYNPDGEWWQANTDTVARNRLIPVLENYLNMSIDETLILATDQKNLDEYRNVERFSRIYLRFWPSGPHAYSIHYNLATVLESGLNEPQLALREYWQVARAYADTANRQLAAQRVVAISQDFVKGEQTGQYTLNPKGEIMPPGTVSAPDTTVSDTTAPLTPAVGDTTKPAPAAEDTTKAPPKAAIKPLLNSEKLMLAGFDYYLENYPTGNLAPLLLYNAGDLLYSHNLFPESRFYLRQLILDFPQVNLVEDAYKLMINGYFQSEDYRGVEEIAEQIAKAKNISPELKKTAYNRKAEAVFIGASSLKKSDSHLEAAQEFKRVALETPDNELAEGALFQSGLEFMAAKTWNDAIESFLLVVTRYPRSQYCDKSLYNTAFIQESELNNPTASAKTFEQMVVKYPQSELCQDALSQASANFIKVEDYRSAIRVNEMYVSRFPNAEDANLYLFENAGHYLKLNQVEQANDIYRRFAEKYPDDPRTVQAHFERAAYALGKNNRPEAAREFKATVDAHEKFVGKGLPGYPKYASLALAHLLNWEHEEYNQLAFRLPVNDLNQPKERKKNWRNSLFEKYQQLLRLGTKEGYQAFYKIGLLDEELAEATYQQEMPEIKDANKRITAITELCDQSILLIRIAVESFKTGITSLTDIETQLQAEKNRRQGEFDSFSELITQLQKDTTAVGVADSLKKLSNLRRGLAELDSALTESQVWRIACRDKLPEVALHNGDYLKKLWRENLDFRSQEKDEEIRMLVREEVLNNGVAPLTAELVGLYLSAWESISSTLPEPRWQGEFEARIKGVLDTLQVMYLEQCVIAKGRLDRNVTQIEDLLPKGEDAKNRQGNTVYDLSAIVLDQVDYWNKFSSDFLTAFKIVLDTMFQHSGLPEGFGWEGRATGLQFTLDQYNRFNDYSALAEERRKRCIDQYSQKNEIQYDDASVAYEDIAGNLTDYKIAILESGYNLKEAYSVGGPQGLEIIRLLVLLKPTEYASRFKIQSEKHSVISSTDWMVSPLQEPGFETVDFNDQNWRPVSVSEFPPELTFGILDSLNAKPIWFNLEKPPAEPVDSSALIDSLTQAAPVAAPKVETDSLWQVWMEPGPDGIRRYWFRKSFQTVAKPSGGRIYITADDNFSLYLNGFYLFEDPQDTIDWTHIEQFDVSPYLVSGTNIIAIVASDVDKTRHGLIAGLIYEIIPDLQRQLDALSKQETKPAAVEPPVIVAGPEVSPAPAEQIPSVEAAPLPEKPIEEPAVSEEVKAYEHRAIVKNKLR